MTTQLSIGAEAITKIVEYKKQGLSLRKIADELNHAGYRTMTGKEFQQAQVKRTLDRLKKNPQLMNTVTPSTETVTTLTDGVIGVIHEITETFLDNSISTLEEWKIEAILEAWQDYVEDADMNVYTAFNFNDTALSSLHSHRRTCESYIFFESYEVEAK